MALADKDIDESIASDWAAIQDKYKHEEPEAYSRDLPTDEPESDVTEEPAKETIPVSREPDGKFKAAEKEQKASKPAADPKVVDPKAAKPLKGAPEPQAPPNEADPATPAARDVNRAPSTWKPTARAEYEKLPAAIKAEIHRREADFQNGQAQLLPDATMGKNMRAVIEPYRMLIEAEGGTPERAVADLFRTAAIFRTGSVQQKYQAVAEIAQQFGIDLRYLVQAATEQQGAPNPQGQPQQNQFRDPRVDQLLAQQNLERQQAAQREKSQMESTVTRWMSEVDASGNPKREYLSDVIGDMSALVPQIQQADPTLTHAQALDAAYDRAIWAHPEIRALLTQKQQTELETQRRADNQKRIGDARKAGSVNVARRASTPSAGKPGTMDDTILATARELGMIS
jgi:hypothetical protein